ncbi:MAG: hypothetical protein RI908_807, partial [Actinomycetota bacterium]
MVRAVSGGVVSQGSVSGRVMAVWTPAVRELLLAVAALFAGFWYLEVPVVNSALFAVAVVLQGALGTVALSRVLGGSATSLLTVLGPGLILGGALAFVSFQVVGRGALGLGAVTLVGAAGALALCRSSNWQPLPSNAPWIIGQVLGLAALAMTWEFGELLPVAAAFYALGFLTGRNPRLPATVRWAAAAAAAALIAAPLALRQDYWWLVTDDYRFFEVLSTHITRSGPFADWGAMNWSRYHWLSYGWSGLLNELGGQPEPFTTLTRVMPLTYSTALAASLIQLTRHVTKTTPTNALTLTPAWAIIALNPLDWSGTSTAGIYAVIGAFFAVVSTSFEFSPHWSSRVSTYLLFAPVILGTKFPALLACGSGIVLLESTKLVSRRPRMERVLTFFLVLIFVYLGSLLAIATSGRIIGGFELVSVNVGLGQFSSFGQNFATMLLVLQRLSIAIPLFLIAIGPFRSRVTGPESQRSLLTLAPLLLLGAYLATVIFSNSKNYEYFSFPMIFVASLGLVCLSDDSAVYKTTANHWSHFRFFMTALALFAVGRVWVAHDVSLTFWNSIGMEIFDWNPSRVSLLQYATSDSRVGIAVTVALICLASHLALRRFSNHVLTSLLMATVLLTLHSYGSQTSLILTTERSTDEIVSNLGGEVTRDAARWLSENTSSSDLMASNHLFDPVTRRELPDMSIAAWSGREFLVLGPEYLLNRQEGWSAVELSMEFGNVPTEGSADRLR